MKRSNLVGVVLVIASFGFGCAQGKKATPDAPASRMGADRSKPANLLGGQVPTNPSDANAFWGFVNVAGSVQLGGQLDPVAVQSVQDIPRWLLSTDWAVEKIGSSTQNQLDPKFSKPCDGQLQRASTCAVGILTADKMGPTVRFGTDYLNEAAGKGAQVQATQGQMSVMVWDSLRNLPDAAGKGVGFTLSLIPAQSWVSGNCQQTGCNNNSVANVNLVFGDNYGTVTIKGTVHDGGTLTATVFFENTVNSDPSAIGRPAKGQLGQITMNACAVMACH